MPLCRLLGPGPVDTVFGPSNRVTVTMTGSASASDRDLVMTPLFTHRYRTSPESESPPGHQMIIKLTKL